MKEQDHCYNLPPQITNTEIRRHLNLACEYADDLINVTTYNAEKTSNYYNYPYS